MSCFAGQALEPYRLNLVVAFGHNDCLLGAKLRFVSIRSY